MYNLSEQDVAHVIEVSRKAGEAILEVYRTPNIAVESKEDRSPLTEADRRSHDIIVSSLLDAYPDVPCLSEEGNEMEYPKRQGWPAFWLIDPLDGTKEFINRRDEFTINVALIEGRRPVFGLIYAPALDLLYWGRAGLGSFKLEKRQSRQIRVNSDVDKGIHVIGSRSHAAPEEDEFYSRFPVLSRLSIGSALKFCRVAEGSAQLYFRSGPTWEWDTAAGHCIVESAGGFISTPQGELLYNKRILTNPSFIASSFRIPDF